MPAKKNAAPSRRSKANAKAKAKPTSKRVEANRRNSQKSTGPRTTQGKNRSRFNAVTHGATAESIVAAFPSPARIAMRSRPWSWASVMGSA